MHLIIRSLSLLALFLSFQATAASCRGANAEPERLFLQQVSDTSAIVRWRGGADTLCYGKNDQRLNKSARVTQEDDHYTARITGLKPDTTYHYSIGGARKAPSRHYFRTGPKRGKLPRDGSLRFWLLGDSGTATEFDREGNPEHPGEAEAVRDGFLAWNTRQEDTHLDAVLLLGDNAYPAGTDFEWQGAYFDIYPDIISRAQTIPTIGNHEMGVAVYDYCQFVKLPGCEKGPVRGPIGGASGSADHMSYDSDGDGPDGTGLPYLRIFSLPTQAELGGAPSGTEQYYSMDVGNVHIVSLDSQLSTQDESQVLAMRDWLIDDLGASQQDFTIVIFHHPPYSKGENHDSDVEQREIDMRTLFAPVFEDHGVDVVYNGHSHSYERSWYLGGHHGKSDTFDAIAHTEHDGDGNPRFGFPGEPYPQVSDISGKDDKAVYTVAGSSGKRNTEHPCPEGQRMGCTLPDWLEHPAHRTFEAGSGFVRKHGLARLGSVVITVTSDALTSTFITEAGEVLDEFVISR